MKNSMLLAIVSMIVLLGFSLSAKATNVWLYGAKIKQIYPYADPSTDGAFVLAFTVNAPSCTAGQTYKMHYVRVGYNDVTATTAKNILAIAMMAFSLDKPVDVIFDNATSECNIRAISLSN